VFNVYTNAPQREGRCDRCGEALVHREDDRPDTIRRRLQVYRDETAPLVRHYQEQGAPVAFVDGEQPVAEVQASIRRAVDGG
jgi:adenylate kinase